MKDWVDEEFATADLGDQRLNKRLVLIARRLADTPSRSVASAVRGATEMHGAYRFFDNEKNTVQKVLSPHRHSTVLRAGKCPRVLLVQDTTELDCTVLWPYRANRGIVGKLSAYEPRWAGL